jgi:hypothetical protein
MVRLEPSAMRINERFTMRFFAFGSRKTKVKVIIYCRIIIK